MKLVIVESPSKIKTIERYLSSDYKVMASFGHVVDLSTRGPGGLGIDLATFEGSYIIDKDKKKVVNELKKAKEEASEVILATDPDREGEAIAYHLAKVLDLDPLSTKRLEFNEITKDAIVAALSNARTIDLDLFNSQESRRMVDRIVGFKLSSLLNKKLKIQSAGRVQSAVLKIVVTKEEEIKAFIPKEYWTLKLELTTDQGPLEVIFNQSYLGSKDIESEAVKNDIVSKLDTKVVVSNVKEETRLTNPKPPFTTSSLQQEASNKFGYPTKKTASIAQTLYEGVSIDGEQTGLVTYIRTDSTRFAPSFIASASNYIASLYGEDYIARAKGKSGASKQKIQDAHEAIRPTDLDLTPSAVKQYLTKEQHNLYQLIYARALASLMPPSKEEVVHYTFHTNGNLFKTTANKLIFEGYKKVYGKYETNTEKSVGPFVLGQELPIASYDAQQKFTEPPARFSEGRLVKTMEELGIGRPSTYSATIETLKTRKYVTVARTIIKPTELGERSIAALSEHFPDLVSSDYTAAMEQDLDKVAKAELTKSSFLDAFYKEFSKQLKEADKNIVKIQPEKVGRICPDCGGDLVYREGKFGKFIACNNFPKCKFIEPIIDYVGEDCPECGSKLIYRYDARGNKYIRCSDYKVCTYAKSLRKTYKKAPQA